MFIACSADGTASEDMHLHLAAQRATDMHQYPVLALQAGSSARAKDGAQSAPAAARQLQQPLLSGRGRQRLSACGDDLT